MSKIITILLSFLLLFTQLPANSAEAKPFIAVFANPGTSKIAGWDKVKPSLYYESTDWENLDAFLAMTKKEAGNRPLVIDIECHGDPTTGMLVLGWSAFGESMDDTASMGYVVSAIDKQFHKKKNLQVCFEACFSQICMEKTLINGAEIEHEDYHVKSFKDKILFPCYGIGTMANWNNTVILEFLTGVRPYFVDLRDFIGQHHEPVFDKELDKNTLFVFRILYLYSIIK